MKKHILYSIVITAFIFASCSSYDSDYYLEQSVFVSDPENPGLPEYSEWGYNTFGTYIDRQAFTSDSYNLPAKIIVYGDTLNLLLTGSGGLFPTSTLKFSFIGFSPKEYTDLIELNNETIDLTDKDKCIITMIKSNETIELTPFNGQFVFSRVQNLYVDNKLDKSIISGRFRFQTEYKNDYITIDKGRFDFSIGYDNFYYIRR